MRIIVALMMVFGLFGVEGQFQDSMAQDSMPMAEQPSCLEAVPYYPELAQANDMGAEIAFSCLMMRGDDGHLHGSACQIMTITLKEDGKKGEQDKARKMGSRPDEALRASIKDSFASQILAFITRKCWRDDELKGAVIGQRYVMHLAFSASADDE